MRNFVKCLGSYIAIFFLVVSVVSARKTRYDDVFSNLESVAPSGSQRNPTTKGISDVSTPNPLEEITSTAFPEDFPTYSPDAVKSRPVQRSQEQGQSFGMSETSGAPSASGTAGKSQFSLMDINTWDSIPAAFFQPSLSAVDRGAKKGVTASHGPAWKVNPLSYSEAGAEPALAWDYSSAGMGSGAESGSGTQDVFLPLADHSPGSIIADQPVMISDWSVPPVSKDTAKYREEPTSRPEFKRFNDGESMARAILSGQVKKWEWTYSTTLGAGLSSTKGDRNDQSITCCQRLPYICGVDGMCVLGIDECKDFCTCAANPHMPHCSKVIPIIKRTMAALEEKILAKVAKELNKTTTSSIETRFTRPPVPHVTRPAAQNVMNHNFFETQNPSQSWMWDMSDVATPATQRPTGMRFTAGFFHHYQSLPTGRSGLASTSYIHGDPTTRLASQFTHSQFSLQNHQLPLKAGRPQSFTEQIIQGNAASFQIRDTLATQATPAPASAKTSVDLSRSASKITPSLQASVSNNIRQAGLGSTSHTKAPQTVTYKYQRQVTSSNAKSSSGTSKLAGSGVEDSINPSNIILSRTTSKPTQKPTSSSDVTSRSRKPQVMSRLNSGHSNTTRSFTKVASAAVSITNSTTNNKYTLDKTSGHSNNTITRSSNRATTGKTVSNSAAKITGNNTNNNVNRSIYSIKASNTTQQLDKLSNPGHNTEATISNATPRTKEVPFVQNVNKSVDATSKPRFTMTASMTTVTAEIKIELKSGDILSISEIERNKRRNMSNVDNVKTNKLGSPIRSSTLSGNPNSHKSTKQDNTNSGLVKPTIPDRDIINRTSIATGDHQQNLGTPPVNTNKTATTPITNSYTNKYGQNVSVSNSPEDVFLPMTVKSTQKSNSNNVSPSIQITTSARPPITKLHLQRFALSSSLPGLNLSDITSDSNRGYRVLKSDLKTTTNLHSARNSTDNIGTETSIMGSTATAATTTEIKATSKPTGARTTGTSSIGSGILATEIIDKQTTKVDNQDTTMAPDFNNLYKTSVTSTRNFTTEKIYTDTSNSGYQSSTISIHSDDLQVNTQAPYVAHTNISSQNIDGKTSKGHNLPQHNSESQNMSNENLSDSTNLNKDKIELSKDNNESQALNNPLTNTTTLNNAHYKYKKVLSSTPTYRDNLIVCNQDCEEKGGVCVVGNHVKSRCVVLIDKCDQIKCVNGHCVSSDDLQTCECHRGWSGISCEKPCTVDCDDRSFCGAVDGNDNVTCICRWKYTGHGCQDTLEILSRNFEVATSDNGLDTWEVAIVSVAAAVVLALLCVLSPYVLWKKQWLPLRKLIFYFQPYEDDDDKEFDAFISYKTTPRDERFVLRHLYPKLEKELEYRLCLHFRDISPGEPNASNIIRAIESSRRIILILSPSYVSTEWTSAEYQKVLPEMLKARNRIIPIVLEDISHEPELDSALKTIVDKADCIKWPGEEKTSTSSDIIKFWKLLELSMPKRRTVLKKSSNHHHDLPFSASKTSFNSIAYALTEDDILTSSVLGRGSSRSDSGNSSEKTSPYDQPKRSSIGKLRFPEVSWSNLRANSIISLTPPWESRSNASSGSDDTGIEMSARSSSVSSEANAAAKRPSLSFHGNGVVSNGVVSNSEDNVTQHRNVALGIQDNHLPAASGHLVDIRGSETRSHGNKIPFSSSKF